MDIKSVKKILAKNIRLFRAEKRFSQEAVASKAQIGQNQISAIENELGNPSLETLVRIAQALDVDFSKLFTNNL